MEKTVSSGTVRKEKTLGVLKNLAPFFAIAGLYFLAELFLFLILKPEESSPLWFGAAWALLLASVAFVLPKTAGRIYFGITYFFYALWAIAQAGYYQVFGKMMWFSTIAYAGEGADYLGDVLAGFSAFWWVGAVVLLGLGVFAVIKFRGNQFRWINAVAHLLFAGIMTVSLCILPELAFLRDNDVWGTRSEYGQSSSYRAAYTTMYDAKRVYDVCGLYQLSLRDLWKNELYPLTPQYRNEQQELRGEIDAYFDKRQDSTENDMTGIFAGKNVVLVLMESMDDWMITPEDTPTLYKLMNEGINFVNFYTPGYGSARTLNSEFCMNTGVYLPTTGSYVFDYVTNSFDQSIANRMNAAGYTSEVFHYNDPNFYSRGVFEPVMGYNRYNCYADYETDKDRLYDDNLLFDIPELNDIFFREGQTFNTIITRSAHLSYVYNEVLSHYALKQYPEYRGLYGSEEEDCARVKAKLVDDMFARLLQELEEKGQLENTVIIGMTDHYTYGYKNMEELYAHSGVDDELLLEKTPCFVWSADGPDMDVEKTLNTSDLLPTVLNLMGIDSPYNYLGQDAFDPNYEGYALFPDGSWITDGVVCKASKKGSEQILRNEKGVALTEEYLEKMSDTVQEYIHISNLLLSSDYYNQPS